LRIHERAAVLMPGLCEVDGSGYTPKRCFADKGVEQTVRDRALRGQPYGAVGGESAVVEGVLLSREDQWWL